jgi:hypothetical protein
MRRRQVAGISEVPRPRQTIAWLPADLRDAPLPSPSTVLTRIAMRYLHEPGQAQPIWHSVLAARPDLFVFTGDNVYARHAGARHPGKQEVLEAMRTAYRTAVAIPLRATRESVPACATWDECVDFGRNDGEFDFLADRPGVLFALAAAVRGSTPSPTACTHDLRPRPSAGAADPARHPVSARP